MESTYFHVLTLERPWASPIERYGAAASLRGNLRTPQSMVPGTGTPVPHAYSPGPVRAPDRAPVRVKNCSCRSLPFASTIGLGC